MLKFIFLIAAFVIYCNAAPYAADKQPERPTPINPDIPSDPKPADKITFIKDDSKIKRDTKQDAKENPQLPGPITLPANQQPNEGDKSIKQTKRDTKLVPSATDQIQPKCKDDHEIVKRENDPSTLSQQDEKDIKPQTDKLDEGAKDDKKGGKKRSLEEKSPSPIPPIPSGGDITSESKQEEKQKRRRRDIPVPVVDDEKKSTEVKKEGTATDPKVHDHQHKA